MGKNSLLATNKNLIKILHVLLAGSFFLCVFAITRQLNFPQLAPFITVFLAMFFFLSLPFIYKNLRNSPRDIIYWLAIYFIFLITLLWYSIVVKDNDIGLAIRFFVILSLLIMAYFVPKRKYIIDIFLIVTVIAALFLIGFELYLMFQKDMFYIARLRDRFIHNGWGDFYSFNGIFYKIQIKGNATLPFAFFVSMVYYKSIVKKFIVAGILLVGVLIAGNFAFLIAVAVFVVLYYLMVSLRDISMFISRFSILVLLSLIVLIPAKAYVELELERKQAVSLSTRGDQFLVLVEDMSKSGIDLLFGKGLGNTVDVTTDFRDYTGAYYYELQTLYILNQTGVVFFVLFLWISILFCIVYWRNKYIYLIYLIYLLYAITNPYLFDTTHIIAIVVLNSLAAELRKSEDHNYSALSLHK